MRPNYVAAIVASGALGVAQVNISGKTNLYNTLRVPSGSKTRIKWRESYDVRADATGFYLVFANAYGTNASESVSPSGTIGVIKLTAEIGSNYYPVTFGGSRSISIPPGTLDVKSDPVMVPVSKGVTTIWVRGEADVPTSWVSGIISFNSGGTGYLYDPVNEVDDVDGVGAMTAPTGYTLENQWFNPLAIVGFCAPGTKSYFLVGDSMVAGQGDDQNGEVTTLGNGAGGYFRRAMYSKGYPALTYGIGGRGITAAQSNGSTLALNAAKYCTHAICNLGTNDIASGGSLSVIQGYLQTFWGRLKGAGLMVYQANYPPRVSTTDNNTTLVNQTPVTGFAAGGVRDNLQAWIPTQVGTAIDGVIDVASVVQDTTTPQKWRMDNQFVTTMAATMAATNTNPISLTASPPIGAALWADVGGATPSTQTSAYVRAVSGTGPFSVTLKSPFNVIEAAGKTVVSSPAYDGIHPHPRECANLAAALAAAVP